METVKMMIELPKETYNMIKNFSNWNSSQVVIEDIEKAIQSSASLNECIECDDAVKQLPSVTPQELSWISVSERLPEESTAVLVWCPERKNIYCAYYEEKQWWIFGAYWEKITLEIIAWMPLPKPYKAESEGKE